MRLLEENGPGRREILTCGEKNRREEAGFPSSISPPLPVLWENAVRWENAVLWESVVVIGKKGACPRPKGTGAGSAKASFV